MRCVFMSDFVKCIESI